MAQKFDNGNFTAVMTEADNVSNASSMTSCFNGADEVEIEELRRMRNVIFGDRGKLIAEYARISCSRRTRSTRIRPTTIYSVFDGCETSLNTSDTPASYMRADGSRTTR